MFIVNAPKLLTLIGFVAFEIVKLKGELPVKFLFKNGLLIVTTWPDIEQVAPDAN